MARVHLSKTAFRRNKEKKAALLGSGLSSRSGNRNGGREIQLYHAPAYEEPFSELERQLRSGKFVVTTEVAPPLSTATGKLKRDIEMVKDLVAAVNFTDSASASPRMSSMACSKIAAELGADPVLQIAARDKTRSGLAIRYYGCQCDGSAQCTVHHRR